MPGVTVAHAEPRRRDAEARLAGRHPQIALERHAEAAADAVAADHRDRRAARRRQTLIGFAHQRVVADAPLLARALLLELRDVGAGDEGLAAGAAQHDRSRTASSASSWSSACGIAAHISTDSALWRSGRLNVIQPTAPSRAASTLPSARVDCVLTVSGFHRRLSLSAHSRRAVLGLAPVAGARRAGRSARRSPSSSRSAPPRAASPAARRRATTGCARATHSRAANTATSGISGMW